MSEKIMQNEDLTFVPLRKHPELLEETASFLNTQWPMSLNGRIQYLAENEDGFPYSLVLLQTEEQRIHHDHPRLIGHIRLHKVLGKPTAAFLSCVVIEKSRRGCGLGKMLMKLTETYVSQLGCTAIYLSTADKCEFYKHLGYQYCSPVTPLRTRSSLFTSLQLALLQQQSPEQELQMALENEGAQDKVCRVGMSVTKNDIANTQDCETNLQKYGLDHNLHDTNKQMKTCLNEGLSSAPLSSTSSLSLQKTVAAIPPPPPPPPPPAPPIPSPLEKLSSEARRTVPAGSFWMMKDLF